MPGVNVRQPSVQVLVNGAIVDAIIGADIQSNAYLGADRFIVHAALTAENAPLWAIVPLQVEIIIGLNGALQSLITGQVDRLEIDPIRGDVHFSGRDLTALLIATQTHESFENLTASDVATLFAERHGLSPLVTATTTLTGRYYQNGHTRTALSQHGRATTEWDVLSWLAQQEGFDVWVTGKSLYFMPAQSTAQTFSLLPQDCIELHLSRDMTIASGFNVQVQSWDSASQSTIVQMATYGTPGAGSDHLITLRPNLSSADAQLLAQRIAAQLSSHELSIRYEAPADITTLPRAQMQLLGTHTVFDGTYTVYEVERRFSAQRGFTQNVEARRAAWTVS